MLKKLYRRIRAKIDDWLLNEPPSQEIMSYDFDRLKSEIRPGDVLLIEGRSRISKVIRTLTQSPWTHAALYIGRPIDWEEENIHPFINEYEKPRTRLIIEDLMDQGTVVTPLHFYRNHHIRICRPRGITPADLELVIKYAVNALGQPYNVRQLLDLARFFLPWTILPRRWGSSLFRTPSGEPESGICSSLIANAFISVQFPVISFIKPDLNHKLELFQHNPYLYTPKDFDYSPYFEIIKYPLFNPDEPLPYYRRLPWSTSGLMHQGSGILTSPKVSKKIKKPTEEKEESSKKSENIDQTSKPISSDEEKTEKAEKNDSIEKKDDKKNE